MFDLSPHTGRQKAINPKTLILKFAILKFA